MSLYELLSSVLRIASSPFLMLRRLTINTFLSVSRLLFWSGQGALPPPSDSLSSPSCSASDVGCTVSTSSIPSTGEPSSTLSRTSQDQVVINMPATPKDVTYKSRGPKQQKMDDEWGAGCCGVDEGRVGTKEVHDTQSEDNVHETSETSTGIKRQWNGRKGSHTSNTLRVNHFVAFRISDPQIIQNVQSVQNQMMSASVKIGRGRKLTPSSGEVFRETLISLTKMHFTLHVMELNDEDDKRKAILATENVWNRFKNGFKENPVTAQIHGMGHFGDSVLFAKMLGSDTISRFTDLANDLRQEMESAEIPGISRPFAPHMTIAKMSKARKLRNTGVRTFPRELWTHSEDLNFGEERLNGIQLLSMTERDSSGYYKSIADFGL